MWLITAYCYKCDCDDQMQFPKANQKIKIGLQFKILTCRNSLSPLTNDLKLQIRALNLSRDLKFYRQTLQPNSSRQRHRDLSAKYVFSLMIIRLFLSHHLRFCARLLDTERSRVWDLKECRVYNVKKVTQLQLQHGSVDQLNY